MANTASAVKRYKQAVKRNARNTAIRSKVKTVTKKAREALALGKKEASAELIRAAQSSIAGAAAKGVFHRRAASRRISRLAKKLAATTANPAA